MKTTHLLLAAALLGSGCTSESPTASQEGFATSLPTATIEFDASWGESLDGPLIAGGQVHVRYDASRLAVCEGSDMGNLAWGVTGHAQIDDGEIQSFDVLSPHRPEGGPVTIELERAGVLSLWFEASNKWGCHEWDSDYGDNYRFTVGQMDTLPSWAGLARSVVTRAMCGGSPCSGDWVDLDEDFHYGTWARQRATVADITFEAWEPGVTDWDNPDMWQTLDAQIHYRFDPAEAFTSEHVDATRKGNNAYFAFSMRRLDPLGGHTILDPAHCPTAPLEVDGSVVKAHVEYYLSIGELEIRPAVGETFGGTFADYADLYAVCGL